MATATQTPSWVENAKLLISRCTSTKLTDSTKSTFCVCLWNCEFGSHEVLKNALDLGCSEEDHHNDTELRELCEHIPEGLSSHNSGFRAAEGGQQLFPPLLPRKFIHAAAHDEAESGVASDSRPAHGVALCQSVPKSDVLLLNSEKEVLRCLIKKVFNEPLSITLNPEDREKQQLLKHKELDERIISSQKMLSGKPAGSCEMIIQIRPAYRVQDPTNKSELPFDSHTTLNLMRAMSLPLRWLSARGDDSGIFYSEVDGQNNRYLFQTPFYKEGSWTLTMNILRPAQDLASLIDLVQVPRTTTIRTKTQSVRIVGMLEIDSSIDLASILDQVHFSTLRLCHPFLLPMQLLEQHVEESARQFMAISQKLDAIEDSTDPSLSDKSFSPEAGGEHISFGVVSKNVYECSNALYVLERRRNFESRFEKFLKVELNRRNEEENRRQAVNGPRDLGRRQLDYEFRHGVKGVYEEENTWDLYNWLDTIRETSGNRDLDMRALPRRIEALTSLIRNLVAQQDSQATIQIARSTMQENVQMTALTKSSVEIANQTKALGIATLKDSNAMKNIAVLTTVFLPGTYIASLFSTTMFNFAEDARYNVSRNIWIYFVITIPLTLVVFVGLQALIKYRERKGIEDQEDEEHGDKWMDKKRK